MKALAKNAARFPVILHEHYRAIYSDAEDLVDDALSGYGGLALIVGPSKVGLTTLGQDLLRKIKPTQLPHLRQVQAAHVTCSTGATPGSFALDILRKLGLHGLGSASHAALVSRAQSQLELLKTQVIVLDRAQHLAEASKSQHGSAIAEAISYLQESLGIGVIMTGSPEIIQFVADHSSLRTNAMKPIEFHPYRWSSEPDRVFFMQALKSCVAHAEKMGCCFDSSTEDLLAPCYAASGGRVGLLVRLFEKITRKTSGVVSRESVAQIFDANTFRTFIERNPFDGEELSDIDLIQCYQDVMREAGLPPKMDTEDDLLAKQMRPE